MSAHPKTAGRMLGGVLVAAAATAALAGVGCRGAVSEDPPFHLISDMQQQAHRRPQTESPVFADHRAMRPLDPNTVAWGHANKEDALLKEDDTYFRGEGPDGKPVMRAPVKVDAALLARGQERFNIYCSPCHDKTGSGNGVVMQRSGGAFAGIPAFYIERLKDAPDGELFQTITHGKARMPSYAAQIPESDRWAIVTWVRVLQQAGSAKLADVPDAEKSKIKEAK